MKIETETVEVQYLDPNPTRDARQIAHVIVPNAKPNDVCIFVSGDGMAPTCPNGSVIQIRQVHDWREHMDYGSIFALFLSDGSCIINEIAMAPINPQDNILCLYHNPKYMPIMKSKDAIASVFKVISVLNL